MITSPLLENSQISEAMAGISRLRQFSGSASEFWPAFLATSGTLAVASRATLVLRDSGQAAPSWRKLGDWAGNGHADRSIVAFNQQLADLGERCAKQGSLIQPIQDSASPDTKHFAVAVRLNLNRPDDVCVAAYLLVNRSEAQAQEALLRLQLISDTPASFLLNSAASQAKNDVEKFAVALDLVAQLNGEKKFLSATLAVCNNLATRYGCDRVSAGWIEDGYVRLKSMSRTERFDKNMDAVKALETVMEEAADQNDEVLWPAMEKIRVVNRDHEKFAREQTSGHICSVPLRVDNKPAAVLTFERQSRPFTSGELQQFRLCADMIVLRLNTLKQLDRWWGARLNSFARTKAAALVGPEHTGAKVIASIVFVALAIALIVPFNYRTEGNFILRSEDVSFLTVPFDGYISEVAVRPGDQVAKGDVLLRLNTDDLALQEVAAVAEKNRYTQEAQKAEAAENRAEMRIAEALAAQAQARLDIIRYRINQAVARAPFDGVVVEGDLRERIGAPVKQGDALFKVARADALYVEAEINQREIQEIIGKESGEIAFVTQPKLKFPVKIDRIEPAAFPKEGENVFVVRCSLAAGMEPWWRPGMSGLIKIEAGKRTLFWMATHRTADFLRMWFWW